MPSFELAISSAVKGQSIELVLSNHRGPAYAQMQIEIYECGVPNPSPKLGFGATPRKNQKGDLSVDIDTNHLEIGIYEIRLIRLHDGGAENQKPLLDLMPKRDFSRTFFEVLNSPENARTSDAIRDQVEQIEQEIENRFFEPLDLRSDLSTRGALYTVFVFIKDVLVGRRIRLDRMELVPTNDGIGYRGAHDLVNKFLSQKTTSGIEFEYRGEIELQSQNASPVCVVHFPDIQSNSIDTARGFCVDKTNALLLALSLSRDAGGSIFDVVLMERFSGRAAKFTVPSSYVGNLLTGQLAGESADSLLSYVEGISKDSMGAFLVELYKEARRERDPRYQYVRLWQLLELLADQEKFDPNEPITDYRLSGASDEGSKRKPSPQ